MDSPTKEKTRRSFIKTSTAAAAVTATSIPRKSKAFESGSEEIKVGTGALQIDMAILVLTGVGEQENPFAGQIVSVGKRQAIPF